MYLVKNKIKEFENSLDLKEKIRDQNILSNAVLGPVPTNGLVRIGKGVLSQLAISPDGKKLGIATSVGLYLYNTDTYELKWFVETETRAVSLAFSPDGYLLISGTLGKVEVWNVQSGINFKTLLFENGWIRSVAFSLDGKFLATAGDTVIGIWDYSKGELLRNLEGHNSEILSLAFSGNELLASGSSDKNIILWNYLNGQLICTLFKHAASVWNVIFTPDGKYLISGSSDDRVIVWDVLKEVEVNVFDEHKEFVVGLSFVDEDLLVSGSLDGEIILWNAYEPTKKYKFSNNFDFLKNISFISNRNALVVGLELQGVYLCDLNDGKILKEFPEFFSGSICLAISKDENIAAVALENNNILLMDIQQLKLISILKGHNSKIVSLAFSSDNYLVSGSSDNIIYWDIKNKVLYKKLSLIPLNITCSASLDNRLIALGVVDGSVIILDTKNLNDNNLVIINRFIWHTEPILSIAFSNDGKKLAVGCSDKSISLWEIENDKSPLRIFEGHSLDVLCVIFSNNGLLASSAADGSIIIWDIESGKPNIHLLAHHSRVRNIAFSHDETLLASASDDNKVIIWKITKGIPLQTYYGHKSYVSGVGFLSGSEGVISTSYDGTTIIWDTSDINR
ncbi:MAG: hypothetical protein H6636_04645 [Anaerolineales bacterium]|nr:hypothetical protein [Anaerolineales bacterium]